LYATLSGFTSARELADLCIHHDAFRWLVGGGKRSCAVQ
jgi:transposase